MTGRQAVFRVIQASLFRTPKDVGKETDFIAIAAVTVEIAIAVDAEVINISPTHLADAAYG